MKQKSSYTKLKEELADTKNLSPSIKKKSRNISETIPYVQTLFRIREDISTFRSALLRAENLHNPSRIELYRLYKDCMLDAQLSSVIQTRKASILSSEFIVSKDGKEDKDLSGLFESKWFFEFCSLALDSMYFGFSLIEFGDLDENNEFKDISLVPREYVKPEFGIVGTTPYDLLGTSFLSEPYSNWTIGVGETHNLGLLAKCAPYVIWKKNAIMAYAEYATMMGVPIRILKTDVYDEETRAAGENFMRNLGTSAYAVLGKDDEVEFAEAKSPAGVEQMFNGLIDKCNSEISKLVLGGTGMVDEKSFVGSAEVHQENFLVICGMDKHFIQSVLNYQLKPFLIGHDFKLEGCKIGIRPDEELSLKESFAIDSKLLDYYKIPAEYFNEKYGTMIFEKEIENKNNVSE